MQVQPFQLTGLLGAVVLSAGLASTLAIADESKESDSAQQSQSGEKQEVSTDADDSSKNRLDEQSNEQSDTIEVRISMPDGRVIVRREPARRSSSKRNLPPTSRVSKTLPDGSRISYGGRGVSGGSNASSARTGGASGGGGSSSARSSGGGGGGSSASAKDSRSNISTSTSMGSGAEEAELLTNEQGSSGASLTPRAFHSGGSNQSNSSGSTSTGSSTSNTGSQSSNSANNRTVPTVGSAQYSQDGAVGGQRVEFHDSGMGAAVIGNTVYFIGVELVQSDQAFEVITGTQVGGDSVMMQDTRMSTSTTDVLSTWNTGASTIKLDFPSDTIVDLRMFSQSVDAGHPNRIERTWTVRIR
ncbi:MAG: hypothetical protein P1U42_09785 [Phycisphaerales bacterium]|nr:hypothetical protein [Phycisphaerales bacterium]